MKRLILILTVIFLFSVAGAAAAQQDLSVNYLQVQLWPEYDRPSMLVIYTLELAENQPLPVDVTVRIPKSVGVPTAVAVLEDTTLVTRQYTRAVNGDWADITLQVDFPVLQIEFYDTALSQDDQPRSYDFRWNADFDVDNLIISVREPVNASGMNIQPSLGQGSSDGSGTTVYASSFGAVSAGETFALSLTYTKNDTTLAALNIQPQTGGSPTASVTNQTPAWLFALIGGGVLVLVGGGVMLFRSNRAHAHAGSYNRKARQSLPRRRKNAGPGKKAKVFCHQCGTQAFAEDKFCRECGTKLRL